MKTPAANVAINRTISIIRLFMSWKSSPTPLGSLCCDWLDFCVTVDMVSFIATRFNLWDSPINENNELLQQEFWDWLNFLQILHHDFHYHQAMELLSQIMILLEWCHFVFNTLTSLFSIKPQFPSRCCWQKLHQHQICDDFINNRKIHWSQNSLWQVNLRNRPWRRGVGNQIINCKIVPSELKFVDPHTCAVIQNVDSHGDSNFLVMYGNRFVKQKIIVI